MQNKILKTVLAVLAILTAGVAIAYELSVSIPVLTNDIKNIQYLFGKENWQKQKISVKCVF